MKTLSWLIGLIIVAALAWVAWGAFTKPSATTMQPTATSSPVTITPIEHATLMLSWADTEVLVDPTDAVALAGKPLADLVLITDIHGDHFSTSTLEVVAASSTLIVPQAVKDLLPAGLAANALVLPNGQATSSNGLTITSVPAYNLPDADNAQRHTKGRGNGYIVERDGYRVYIAGDTAGTPEMRALTNIDVAFVPMNMPYTMGVEEAAEAVLAFKPKTVYPYHYRTPEGLSDVAQFKALVNQGDPNISVVLANWYPAQ